ncbi:hypothetical protein ACFLTK_04735, partial [Chloroflexota bacterium]
MELHVILRGRDCIHVVGITNGQPFKEADIITVIGSILEQIREQNSFAIMRIWTYRIPLNHIFQA